MINNCKCKLRFINVCDITYHPLLQNIFSPKLLINCHSIFFKEDFFAQRQAYIDFVVLSMHNSVDMLYDIHFSPWIQ